MRQAIVLLVWVAVVFVLVAVIVAVWWSVLDFVFEPLPYRDPEPPTTAT
jgi:hypothetical protein